MLPTKEPRVSEELHDQASPRAVKATHRGQRGHPCNICARPPPAFRYAGGRGPAGHRRVTSTACGRRRSTTTPDVHTPCPLAPRRPPAHGRRRIRPRVPSRSVATPGCWGPVRRSTEHMYFGAGGRALGFRRTGGSPRWSATRHALTSPQTGVAQGARRPPECGACAAHQGLQPLSSQAPHR